MNVEAQVRTVEYTEASRLPEPQWFWRRWLIYGGTAWAMLMGTWAYWPVNHMVEAGRAVSSDQLMAMGSNLVVIRFSFYTVWGAILLYGVGASVTDVAHLITAMRTARKETVTKADSPASIKTAEASVDVPPQRPPEEAPWARD